VSRAWCLAIALALAAAATALAAPEGLRIAIRAVGPDGSPIANATVLVFNVRTLRAQALGLTNASGWFEVTVPSNDYYMVYVLKISNGSLTHVPVRIDLTGYPGALAYSANVVLYPAACVRVFGRIVYLGGQPTGSVRIFALDREGGPLSQSLAAGSGTVTLEKGVVGLNPTLVDAYGPMGDYAFLKRGLGAEILKPTEALVPAGVPVRVVIEYSVIELDTWRVVPIRVERGSRESPIELRPGEELSINMLSVSLQGQIQRAKQEYSSAESMVAMYEAMGFYVPELHDALRLSSDYIAGAEQMFARGGPPERVLALLEAARAIDVGFVPKRLGFLRDIAKLGAMVMPSFLAVFAAILAFYFFDSQRAKMASFTALYAMLVLAFAYVYPGFRLLWTLDRNLFLATVAGSYAVFFLVVFIMPRVIREPELPGEVSLGGLVAIAFTLGKRYSKVKALRTFITVFSVAAFIWAFTVLATFGAVYEKIEERGFARYPSNVLILRRFANETPLPLNAELDPLLFEGRSEVGAPQAIVFNRPDVTIRAAVSYKGREVVLHSVMGITPGELELNPALASCIKLVRGFTNDSVILPASAWSALGLQGGETLEVTFEEGFGRERVRLVAAGFFDADALAAVRDPDGTPLRPFTRRGDGGVAYVNASTLLIANSNLLLHLFTTAEGGYSQVFFIYRLSAQLRSSGMGLASEIIDRRGESYVAIACFQGQCGRVYYGTRVRGVFEQEATFLVPLAIVVTNVLITMISIVRERRREIFIFTTVGFNPRHIALVFLAEAIVYGLLSGGFGYVTGLVSFRVLSAFAANVNLMVREKLEWYWSYLAIALAVAISVIGAIKPSMDAAYMFAPTEVRRIKISEVREKVRRTEHITRTVAAKTFSIPGAVMADEGEAAFSYIYSKLADLSYGELEAVRNLTEHPEEERPDGTRIKRFTFRYVSTMEAGAKAEIDCELRFVLSPGAESYRVELETKPVGEAPISHMDYAAELVKRIVGDWMSERERVLYAG